MIFKEQQLTLVQRLVLHDVPLKAETVRWDNLVQWFNSRVSQTRL